MMSAITMDEAVRRLDGGGELTAEEKLSLVWMYSAARDELDRRLVALDRERHPEHYRTAEERKREEEERERTNREYARAARDRAEAERRAGPRYIRERKEPQTEDRGWGFVQTGNSEDFLVPVGQRARDTE